PAIRSLTVSGERFMAAPRTDQDVRTIRASARTHHAQSLQFPHAIRMLRGRLATRRVGIAWGLRVCHPPGGSQAGRMPTPVPADAGMDQSHFLAVLGHELRGPLAALLVSAELLTEDLDALDLDQIAALLGAIQRRARGLQTLTDNLLASTGIATVERELFPARDLVAHVRDMIGPLLATAG